MTWSEPAALPDAGWYADPAGTGGLRYWDGRAWTGYVTPPGSRPAGGPEPASPAAAAPSGPGTPTWVWVALGLTALLFLGGVVAAIAVPFGRIARDAAWDEAAKEELRGAHAVAIGVRAASETTLAVTPEALTTADDGARRYTGSTSIGPDEISVFVTNGRITLAARSRSGTCWVIDDASEEARGSFGERRGRLQGEGECSAAAGGGSLIVDDF